MTQFRWIPLRPLSSESLGYCLELEGLAPGALTGYRFYSNYGNFLAFLGHWAVAKKCDTVKSLCSQQMSGHLTLVNSIPVTAGERPREVTKTMIVFPGSDGKWARSGDQKVPRMNSAEPFVQTLCVVLQLCLHAIFVWIAHDVGVVQCSKKTSWHNSGSEISVVREPGKFSQPLVDWTGSLAEVTEGISFLRCQENDIFINQLPALTPATFELNWFLWSSECLILAFQEWAHNLLKTLTFWRHFFPGTEQGQSKVWFWNVVSSQLFESF